jgi:hypothetical protein
MSWVLESNLAVVGEKVGKEIVVRRAKGTTQTCSGCGAKAKPRIELSDRVHRCRESGLVVDRDRNAARSLRPVRAGLNGGTEPSRSVTLDDEGDTTEVPAGTLIRDRTIVRKANSSIWRHLYQYRTCARCCKSFALLAQQLNEEFQRFGHQSG